MEGPAIGLLEEADNSDVVASILYPLRDCNVQDDVEITTIIDLLTIISSLLKDINLAMGSPGYARNMELIDEDLEVILPSLHLTLMPVLRIFNRYGLSRLSRATD